MILSMLKQATQPYHEQIGRNSYSAEILADDISRAYYGRLLKRFYGFYTPLEGRIAPGAELAALGIDLEARSKAPLLRRDLLWLGSNPASISQLPICRDLPLAAQVPQALGCMYVLEGSTLGGQLIARHVRAALDLTDESGCAFFTSYGAQLGPMWKAFGAALTGYSEAHPDAAPQIVESACATFTAFGRWLAA